MSAETDIDAIVAIQGELKMQMVTDCIVPVLYQALVEHCSLPQAMAKVRHALFSQGPNEVSWFMPVLYMRRYSQDSYLVPARINALQNPFLGQGARKDPRLFLGRKRQVQEMWRFIRFGSSFSIVGPSGSGKTSMLRLLDDEAGMSRELGKKVRVIWLDIEAEMKFREAEEYVVRILGGKRGDRLRTLSAHQPLILLLDDLGALEQGRDKGAAFLTWLKNLLNMDVQVIVTSRQPLKTFQGLASPSSSSLAEQMSEEIELGLFKKEEARYFVRERLANTPFKPEQFEGLLRDEMSLWDLEKACRKRYDELVEPH